jgi:hypothetical protein
MSVPGVPGQGLLTILLGVMLLDFPGRRSLELKVSQQALLYSRRLTNCGTDLASQTLCLIRLCYLLRDSTSMPLAI